MSKTDLLSTTQWGRAMMVLLVYVGGRRGGSVRRAVDKECSDCVGNGWCCLVDRCQNTNEFWTFQVDAAEGVMRTYITQEPRRMDGVMSRTERRDGREPSFLVTSGRSQGVREAGGKVARQRTPLSRDCRRLGVDRIVAARMMGNGGYGG